MRILFISAVGFIGGAERILLECVRQVRSHRPSWSVTVLMLADGPLRDAVTRLGANVEIVSLPSELAAAGDSPFAAQSPSKSASASGSRSKRTSWYRWLFVEKPSAIGFFWKLRRAIRRLGPDLVHSNGLKSHLCLAVAQSRGYPVLWHIHDFYSHRPKVQRWVRLASRRVRGCFAISSSVANDIQSVAPRLAVHLLENGVDVDHFQLGVGNPMELDRMAGFSEPSSAMRVGLVATYANWKGHAVFLEAISQIPNVRGYIVGGPIYTTEGSQWTESELRSKARQLGIADRVGFVPFQSDPCWIYQSLDVVVHASTRPEPFGLTIAEAMACGRPVVVSASGGAGSLFTDHWDAIGHESGNVESLAKAIEQLTVDAKLRQQIGQRARQTAIDRFSTSRFGRTLIDVYDSVLKGA